MVRYSRVEFSHRGFRALREDGKCLSVLPQLTELFSHGEKGEKKKKKKEKGEETSESCDFAQICRGIWEHTLTTQELNVLVTLSPGDRGEAPGPIANLGLQNKTLDFGFALLKEITF